MIGGWLEGLRLCRSGLQGNILIALSCLILPSCITLFYWLVTLPEKLLELKFFQTCSGLHTLLLLGKLIAKDSAV